MRFRLGLTALLVLLVQSPSIRAKDAKWFEVSSEHFLLFTDTTEAKGRRLLTDFENRVAAFSDAFGTLPPRQFPIEIFLFNEEPDFAEALPRVPSPPNPLSSPNPANPASPVEDPLRKNAYLLRGPDRVFIVSKDKSPDDIANDVAHALGHVLFERYGVWRPFWLAEGTAEYVRKIGRGADTKSIKEEDGFSAADVLTIVPSANYKDSDPPTPFRAQSYRLVRLLLDQKPDVLKQYAQSLSKPSPILPKFPLEGDTFDAQLKTYVEAPLKASVRTPAVKSLEADPAKLAIHHGDLLLATDRQADAARWYNADSKDARAARAIVTRFSRPGAEAVRVLERASRELPEYGLVQYHFGVMDIQDPKDIQSQVAALERAVQSLPLLGRAFAELARVYALTGQANKGLTLIAKAIELEPEYADHFYEVRADVHLALGESAEALKDINIASDLPHADRSTVERYNLKVSEIRKRIESARREVALRELEQLRSQVRAEAEEREPPPKPAPPPPPVPSGNIGYEIETRAPIEVVDAVYPDYPEVLRQKGAAGTIALRVDIGADGKVTAASIATSQVPDLNNSAIAAVKKWVFKPGNRSIRVVLKFSLQ